MNKTYILMAIIIGVLSVFPGVLFAFDGFDFGGQYNPINIQIQQTQAQKNQQTAAGLQTSYGATYWSCREKVCSTVSADPQSEASCLIAVQARLSNGLCGATSPQNIESTTSSCPLNATFLNGSCRCNAGYVSYGNVCILPTQYESFSGHTQTCNDNEMHIGSGCLSFTCSEGRIPKNGKCVLEEQPQSIHVANSVDENNAICRQDWGIGSLWNGQVLENGDIECDCSVGYTWNSAGTWCDLETTPTDAQIYEYVSEAPSIRHDEQSFDDGTTDWATWISNWEKRQQEERNHGEQGREPQESVNSEKRGFWARLFDLFR